MVSKKTEFKEPHADLEALVEASQALELLGEMPSSDEACKVVKRNQKQLLDKMTPSHIHNLAEIYRLFKCDSLSSVSE